MLQVDFQDIDARAAVFAGSSVWFGFVRGDDAGDLVVEGGPVRHDAEGLDGRGGNPERWAAGGWAGDFPAVRFGQELFLGGGNGCGWACVRGDGRDVCGVCRGDADFRDGHDEGAGCSEGV